MRKFRFKVKRVVKFELKQNQPDYYSIIRLNKTDFKLTGWLGGTNSDLSFVLEEITNEMLLKDDYLRKEYFAFKDRL